MNTPFNEEEPVKRTDDRNADDASRILIHDEQDESHDIIRFKMHYVDNTFMIMISHYSIFTFICFH